MAIEVLFESVPSPERLTPEELDNRKDRLRDLIDVARRRLPEGEPSADNPDHTTLFLELEGAPVIVMVRATNPIDKPEKFAEHGLFVDIYVYNGPHAGNYLNLSIPKHPDMVDNYVRQHSRGIRYNPTLLFGLTQGLSTAKQIKREEWREKEGMASLALELKYHTITI